MISPEATEPSGDSSPRPPSHGSSNGSRAPRPRSGGAGAPGQRRRRYRCPAAAGEHEPTAAVSTRNSNASLTSGADDDARTEDHQHVGAVDLGNRTLSDTRERVAFEAAQPVLRLCVFLQGSGHSPNLKGRHGRVNPWIPVSCSCKMIYLVLSTHDSLVRSTFPDGILLHP